MEMTKQEIKVLEESFDNYIKFDKLDQINKIKLDIEMNDDVYYALSDFETLLGDYKMAQTRLRNFNDFFLQIEYYEMCSKLKEVRYIEEREFVRLVALYNLTDDIGMDERNEMYNKIIEMTSEVWGK